MLILDRFEGSFAICEQDDSSFVTIPRFLLPTDCKEGDCFERQNDSYIFLKEETKRRKDTMNEKMRKLFED